MSISAPPLPPPERNYLAARNIIDYINSPSYANDVALQDQIDALTTLVAGGPAVFRGAVLPDAAKEEDLWIKTDENNQLYVCNTTYISGAGAIGNWSAIHDSAAQSTADSAALIAGSATQTVIASEPPDGFTDGWVWVNSGLDETGSYNEANQPYVCISDYAQGLPVASRWANFEQTSDVGAQRLAASAQGAADGKTTTYRSDTSPESADAADRWVDSNNDDSTYFASAAYDKADWDNDVGGVQGIYANRDLYGDSFWLPINDPAARAAAAAASALADGKTVTYYQDALPDSGDLRDLWVETDNSNQVWVCVNAYTSGNGTPSDWEKTTDPAAQAKADLAKLQADRKTITFFQPSVPEGTENSVEGYIDLADTWIDTNDNNAAYICEFRYKAAGTYTDATHAVDDGEVWAIGTAYTTGDIVRYSGVVYTALQATTGDQPDVSPASWDNNGGKTTSASTLEEWRAEQWAATTDKQAQDLAVQAEALADGKSRTIFSSTLPVANALGYTIDVGDQWYETDTKQSWIANTQQVPGEASGAGDAGYWTESADPVAQATADAAIAAVDSKRTTFYTAAPDADTSTKVPGPGATQIPIDPTLWDTVGGAKEGDIWINIDGATVRTRICVNSYLGTGGDLGATTDWNSLALDADSTEYLALQLSDYYKLDGSNALTDPIDFAPVAGQQVFNGLSGVITEGLQVRYGGTQSAPGGPSANADAVPKKYVDDEIIGVVGILGDAAAKGYRTDIRAAGSATDDDAVSELGIRTAINQLDTFADGITVEDTVGDQVVINNTTESDTGGERAAEVLFQGKKIGGALAPQAKIKASSEGVADLRGQLELFTTSGSGTLNQVAKFSSAQILTLYNDLYFNGASRQIHNVDTPSISSDVATKGYVDNASLTPQQFVQGATTGSSTAASQTLTGVVNSTATHLEVDVYFACDGNDRAGAGAFKLVSYLGTTNWWVTGSYLTNAQAAESYGEAAAGGLGGGTGLTLGSNGDMVINISGPLGYIRFNFSGTTNPVLTVGYWDGTAYYAGTHALSVFSRNWA